MRGLSTHRKLCREEVNARWRRGEMQQLVDIWADGVTPDDIGIIALTREARSGETACRDEASDQNTHNRARRLVIFA